MQTQFSVFRSTRLFGGHGWKNLCQQCPKTATLVNSRHCLLSPQSSVILRSRIRPRHTVLPQVRTVLCPSSEAFEVDSSEFPSPIEETNSFLLRVRGVLFYLWTVLVSVPLFVFMALFSPVIWLFDRHRRGLYSTINSIWATLCSWPFFGIEIEGKENLPKATEAAVYVANHQSYLDIFSLLVLNRPFKFISKSTIFLFPFVGWSMFLTGHIMLNRVDRKSQLQCLKQCQKVLKNGASVLFFPEGTRSDDGEVKTFKKGAFSVAVNTESPIVPITLTGTGRLMQKSKELEFHSGKVKIKIHPKISTTGANAETLSKTTRDLIASALVDQRILACPNRSDFVLDKSASQQSIVGDVTSV